MVGSNDRPCIRHPRDKPMPKWRQRRRILQSQLLSSRKVSFESDHPQCDHDLNSLQMLELVQQIRPAIGEFRRQRLIVGGSAVDRRGDVAIDQSQAIIAVDRRRLIGETKIVQSPLKPIS